MDDHVRAVYLTGVIYFKGDVFVLFLPLSSRVERRCAGKNVR